MSECKSTYDVGGGEVLHCTGVHLIGNPFRDGGVVHQAPAYGVDWTWYTSEEDK